MTTTTTVTKAEDRIREQLHDAREHLAERKAAAVRTVEDRVTTFAAWMKQHPIAALGVGLALGYVAARLVHRGP
jgi:ElaB/YqjD/DUF883 family membrane-anchored ribosome-binding protein